MVAFASSSMELRVAQACQRSLGGTQDDLTNVLVTAGINCNSRNASVPPPEPGLNLIDDLARPKVDFDEHSIPDAVDQNMLVIMAQRDIRPAGAIERIRPDDLAVLIHPVHGRPMGHQKVSMRKVFHRNHDLARPGFSTRGDIAC